MNVSVRNVSRSGRLLIARRLATVAPPSASQEQIFIGTGVVRRGTSLGTDDEWQAALSAQEKASEQDLASEVNEGSDDASLFASNRVGQVSLPPTLIDSVNLVLAEAQGSNIRNTALRFYESLKLKNEGRTNDVPMPPSREFTGIEADAYIAGLMPQLYASVYTVLLELRKRLGKDWNPRTILDCGMGPGTAGLAFNEVFVKSNPHPPEHQGQMTIIECNDGLRLRTESIWSTNPESAKPKPDDFTSIYHKLGNTGHKHDLILAPHVLGDVKGRPSERDNLVRDLWGRLNPDGVLLLLERGNPLGFEQIARARQLLLRNMSRSSEQEGHIIAPCPHDGQCPMYLHGHQPGRRQWCHFSQRLQRPDFLQRTKHAKDNIEDVGYSYILIRKGGKRPPLPLSQAQGSQANSVGVREEDSIEDKAISDRDIVSASYHWSRIILPPLKRHKHILLDVCSAPSGQAAVTRATSLRDAQNEDQNPEEETTAPRPRIQRITIPKSQGPVEYKFARKSHWGDLLPYRGKTVIDKKELDFTTDEKSRKSRKIRTRRDHTGDSGM